MTEADALPTLARGAILLLEDNRLFSRELVKFISPSREVRHASTVAGGVALLTTHRDWAGFIIDLTLGDESGFPVLEQARRRHPTVPALIVTGAHDPDEINRAFRLSAAYLCKPFPIDEIRAFLARVNAHEADARAVVHARVEAIARQARLSSREADVLGWAVSGYNREEMLLAGNFTENTLKYHIRHILKKTGAENLAELAVDLLRVGPFRDGARDSRDSDAEGNRAKGATAGEVD